MSLRLWHCFAWALLSLVLAPAARGRAGECAEAARTTWTGGVAQGHRATPDRAEGDALPFEGDGDEEGEDGDIEDDLDALPMAFGDAPRLAPGASRSFHPRADAPAPDDLANGPDTPPPRI